jgi:hypothetical protein
VHQWMKPRLTVYLFNYRHGNINWLSNYCLFGWKLQRTPLGTEIQCLAGMKKY